MPTVVSNMKKFFDGGEYFVLTSYRIKAVPISDDDEVSLTLAKTICEDACYLSSAGNGQTAIEILRIAGRKAGSRTVPCHSGRVYQENSGVYRRI